MLLGRPSRWPSRSAGPPRGLLVPLARIRTPSLPPSSSLLSALMPRRPTDPPVRRLFGLVESQTDVNIDVSRNGGRELRQVRFFNMAECTSLSSLHWGWKIELSSAAVPSPTILWVCGGMGKLVTSMPCYFSQPSKARQQCKQEDRALL